MPAGPGNRLAGLRVELHDEPVGRVDDDARRDAGRAGPVRDAAAAGRRIRRRGP